MLGRLGFTRRTLESLWMVLSAAAPSPWPSLENYCCLRCCWTAASLHHWDPSQGLGKAYVIGSAETIRPCLSLRWGLGEAWEDKKASATSEVQVILPASVETHEMGKSLRHRGMGFRCWAVKTRPGSTTLGTPFMYNTKAILQNKCSTEHTLGNTILDSSHKN